MFDNKDVSDDNNVNTDSIVVEIMIILITIVMIIMILTIILMIIILTIILIIISTKN